MVASTAFSAPPGWSVCPGIRWSVSRGIGGQFAPESGGQYQRILHLKREMIRLKAFIEPSEEYSGMARQVVGEFLWSSFNIKI